MSDNQATRNTVPTSRISSTLRAVTSSIPLKRFLIAVAFFLLVIGAGALSVIVMKNSESKLLIGAVSLLAGIGLVWAFFFASNKLVQSFPRRLRKALEPYVFVGPALFFLGVFIVFPAVQTVYLSFFEYTRKAGELGRFGLQNYAQILRDDKILLVLRNNVLWIILVPSVSVICGLVIAVLVDRIRWERIAKSFIFLPMAISFVGASIIWRFVYYFSAYGEQIGLLNALVVWVGGDAQGWLRLEPGNNFLLILIMVWLQTGFAMVVLSAAVKAISSSLLEAARIDGANEFQIFFRIIIPSLAPTILTVVTAMVTVVLKVFDIVFVMTSGQFNTNVVANMMYKKMFTEGNYGVGSALAVLLFIAIIPILIRNIRHLREGGVSI